MSFFPRNSNHPAVLAHAHEVGRVLFALGAFALAVGAVACAWAGMTVKPSEWIWVAWIFAVALVSCALSFNYVRAARAGRAEQALFAAATAASALLPVALIIANT